MSTRFYDFGPFRIDKLNHVLLRDGETIPLKPKVFDTLLVLVEGRDRVLDKDELMKRLWPDTVVEEANLSQNIYLLRKILGESVNGETYIGTIPKRGYRFVATVNKISDTDAIDSLKQPEYVPLTLSLDHPDITETVATSSSRFKHRNRKVSAFALALCLVLSLGVLSSYLLKKNRSPTLSTPRVQSLAVLPFKPLGPDSINEVQGFGMADTLITRLSNARKFVVRPTSAVRKFNSAEQDPVVAGRELQVDAVLDTTVRRVGASLRVTMQLVRVSDGSAVWAAKFDQDGNDFLAVQDRLSEQVAQTLIPQMTGEEQKRFWKRDTENAEAYQFYMMGRYHWGKVTREDWTKALEYFNLAIEKDPNYALAYSGLADAYSSIIADSLLAKTEAIPKAKEAALAALRLDNTLAEPHVSLARVKAYYDWDWAGAEVEFKRALELNPNSSDALREYSGYLTALSRNDEAVAEAKRARKLDPLSQLANFHVAWALISARRFDEAKEQSEQVLRTFPEAHLWIAWANIGKGQFDEAIANLQQRLSVSKADLITTAQLGYAYGASGKQSEARRVLAELELLYERGQASPYLIAVVCAGLDDKKETFAWLERAYKEHSRSLAWGLKVNPSWDGLRSDPRFADLLRHMGLPR
jgi:DNA-binding winged helix-turn-helix (wHTH) protein/TolB-like protein/Flp pilus assembly protein TadD